VVALEQKFVPQTAIMCPSGTHSTYATVTHGAKPVRKATDIDVRSLEVPTQSQ
jgi:hypothetical protein